jgi:hypothetical protein
METACINIADVAVTFTCGDQVFMQQIKKAYRLFLSEHAGMIEFNLALCEAAAETQEQRSSITNDGGTAVCYASRGGMQWEMDVGRKAGVMHIVRDIKMFDIGLRTLWSWLLPFHGGMLIHAAAVQNKGGGYVFFGPSHAGKSTIAASSLAEGKSVITDELAAIRKIEGTYRLFSTPFHGEFSGAVTGSDCPLRMLIQPVKSAVLSIQRMHADDAIVPLLQTMMNFDCDTARNKLALEIVTDMVETVRLTRMEFRKDDMLWEAIIAHGNN